MAKRRTKRLNLKIAVVAIVSIAAIAGLFQMRSKSAITVRKISVNGQEVEVLQSGRGPHLIVLAPETSSVPWHRVADAWLQDYTLTVLKDLRPEALSAVLHDLKATNVYLLGYDAAAAKAIETAAENKDRIGKLILISPKLDDSWKWRASAAQISQPTLLLWGRNDPDIKSDRISELNHGLRNAQMSFHPHSQQNLLKEQPDWVTGKVKNFIQHTR